MEVIMQEMKDNYCMDRECCICYEKFMKVSQDEYEIIMNEIRIQYGEDASNEFENTFPNWLCFPNRFICTNCRNNDMCYSCLSDLTNEKIAIYPECKKIQVVICPFCRSENKRIPESLLEDIKLRNFD